MRNLLSIIKTNLKVVSRSRLSTILVLLAPILIVFLVGSAFSSSSLGRIDMGVYSESYSDLTNSILDELEKNQFIPNYADSKENCIDFVKSGLVDICVIFPSNLSITGNEDSIIISADNSRMDLTYNLINEINFQISEKASELGIIMTGEIIKTLSEVEENIQKRMEELRSLTQNVNELSSKKDFSSQEISQLESQINSLNNIILDISTQNVSDSTKEDLNTLNTQLTNIKSELSQNTEGISSLNIEIGNSVMSLSSKLETLLREISFVGDYEAEKVVTPIRTHVEFINKDSTNWEKLFPTLIALIILLSSMVLSSTMVLNERKSKAHFRNFMTPTSDAIFILGIYLTSIIIISIQLLVLFVGTVYLTGISLFNVAGGIALISFLSVSTFIFVGMFIGYLFKSDETIILASISVASFFIFFSNIIFPTETMVGSLRYISFYNPLFILENILRKLILFDSNIFTMVYDMLLLLGICVLFFFLSLIFRRSTKRGV